MKRLIFISALLFAGCSTITSSTEFKQKRASLSDSEVCRTLINSYENGNYDLYSDALSEAFSRELTYNSCKQKISNQNAFAAILAVTTVAVVAASANKNTGSAYPATPQPIHDVDWAWDEFYNEYRQLVWACRGKQSGQFAPDEKCMFKLKGDFTWPSK